MDEVIIEQIAKRNYETIMNGIDKAISFIRDNTNDNNYVEAKQTLFALYNSERMVKERGLK